MRVEVRPPATVDRCLACEGLWFDATELDRSLTPVLPRGGDPPEERIPDRGVTSRRCPRCDIPLRTAGWTGLVLDRCTRCRGLFVESREWQHLLRNQAPYAAAPFEEQLQALMVQVGWTLLGAEAVVSLLVKFWK